MKTPPAHADAQLPHFPALTKCILIDARYASRMELIKDLKASALFEEVVEAKSLIDGLAMLEMQEVDAIFLGPSVTFEKAAEFIQQGIKRGRSKDCAFVAVISPENQERELYEKSGVHGIIQRPFSRHVFTENVVKAIVKVNAGSPWKGILLNAKVSEPSTPNSNKNEQIGPAQDRLYVTAPLSSAPEVVPENDILVRVLATTTPALKQIIERIENGELGIDLYGTPDEKATQAIRALVEHICQDHEQGGESAGGGGKFREFLEGALQEWFVDVVTVSQRAAAENLRQRLQMYSS